MRKGDSNKLFLNYTVNGKPLGEEEYDELEFTMENHSYLLSQGEIEHDMERKMYLVSLTQEDTFALSSNPRCQLRVRKGDTVKASAYSHIEVGETLSRRII